MTQPDRQVDWTRARMVPPDERPGSALRRARRIVIIGAELPAGVAVADELAAPGIRMALIGADGPELGQAAAGARARGAVVTVLECDPADAASTAAASRAAVEAAGYVDVVVATAGAAERDDPKAPPGAVDDARRMAELNYLAVVAALEPVLAGMRAHGAGQAVVTTSASARNPLPGWSAYAASKAALDAWCRAVRPGLEEQGVRFSVLETRAGGSGRRTAERIMHVVASGQAHASPLGVRLSAAIAAVAPVSTARAESFVTTPRGLWALRRRAGGRELPRHDTALRDATPIEPASPPARDSHEERSPDAGPDSGSGTGEPEQD